MFVPICTYITNFGRLGRFCARSRLMFYLYINKAKSDFEKFCFDFNTLPPTNYNKTHIQKLTKI